MKGVQIYSDMLPCINILHFIIDLSFKNKIFHTWSVWDWILYISLSIFRLKGGGGPLIWRRASHMEIHGRKGKVS